MISEAHPTVSLHNVAETVSAAWDADGDRLLRVPESVGTELRDDARDRLRHPTNSEVRFVPMTDDAEIEVTLSAAERTEIRVFWGEFQPWQALEINSTPTTLTLRVPDRLADLASDVPTGRFDRRVCRIRFERFTPVAIHDVSGACRPPTADERPGKRYLAYGTSITEGAKASATHLSYVSRVAQNCGYDALNFGCSGSAHCEPALAEYLAGRDDWDVATLALSVNMANAQYITPEFYQRADYFVNTIAEANPEKTIVCVTLFPYFADLTTSGDTARADAFRDALRTVVETTPHDTVSLVDGSDLLSPTELTWDVLHPSDRGMGAIGDALSAHLETVTR
ncbi:GDSL family lipase [Natronolimnobius sp. AArcel1]|uniref:GDSL-type esterase/lipase family protein n=1 Tax=Natronolimnobius sp. AArcel1 TaxID=1679093 RepID=UPI0013EB8517|nr:GDSL-type esterase/lipase family protein [Natronolimnobius sp. AArcel1]NGM69145.1 GDSL family lipase [Natronolimnobius sp. AArcel1]